MEIINKNKVVIAVVLPILILVIIRSLSANYFKGDAKKWAEPSIVRSNIINLDKLENMQGERLIINLDDGNHGIKRLSMKPVNIPADSILSKINLKTIRNHDGPVLLFSSDAYISARVWMVLSQMGCRNIFILTDDVENEVLKYKFRPDTLVKPEF